LRILLVDPPDRVSYKSYLIPSLGLATLAAVLRRAGHAVNVFSSSLHTEPDSAFGRVLAEQPPELVGFSAPTCKIVQAARLARNARDKLPEATLAVGGWHASAAPEETLRSYPVFDYAFVGEAERSLTELVAGRDPAAIAGLYRRQGEEVLFSGRPSEPVDLNSLPRPAWDLFDLKKTVPMYRQTPGGLDYPLMAKRGCPYRCLFCKDDTGERTVRYREPDDLFAEVHEAVGRWGADGVQFFDETFTLDAARTEALCERWAAEGLTGRVLWNCATRADRVSRELLSRMKRAGCRVVQFGIESGNQAVLNANRKQTTLQQCLDAARWCREIGLISDMSFIFGLPTDARFSVKDTARFSRRLDPDFVTYFAFIPYPGTPAGELARRGEANLRLLHTDYESYEQQYSLPCELQDYSARRLTLLRFISYARFYFRPRKWRNLRTMLDLRALPRIAGKLLGDLLRGRG